MHRKRLGKQNFWPVKGVQIVRESNSQILKRLTVESSSRCEAKRFGSWYWDPGGHFPCLQKRTRISSKRELIFQANLNQIGFLPLPICDHILGSWFNIRSKHPGGKRLKDLKKRNLSQAAPVCRLSKKTGGWIFRRPGHHLSALISRALP